MIAINHKNLRNRRFEVYKVKQINAGTCNCDFEKLFEGNSAYQIGHKHEVWTIGFYLLPIFTVRPQKIYWTELTLIQLHTIKISNMFENLSCMTNENLNNIKKNKN